MPARSVTYTFKGQFANLTAGLATAGRNVTELGAKMVALDKSGAKMRAGLTQIGGTAGKIGLVAAAGVAVAVRAAANFEQAMSDVQAATHETSGNMDLLRQAAIDAGQATQFSATEAASAIENLAKAGVSTKDILGGGLTGAMSLAAAGGLEVADAAEIAATALTQFNLQGKDVPHVADLLAAGAGKAQGDVSDLSMALKQSGLVASQMGLSIEETTGTLAAFASAGLLGSDAGTSFRTMLLRMANPTKESAKLMDSLGISAYDAQGNFVGIKSLSEQLQVAFQGQTQATRDAALAQIFGSDAIRAANVLYNQGAQGIQDWTNKVNDQGYAAETAAIKMDNLKGDLEQLRGSLETALIGAGGGSQGPLRTLVQDATTVVNVFNKMPGPIQGVATSLGAITAITGGSLWFGAKVISGIAETRKALDNMGASGDKASKALRGVALAGAGLAALQVAGAVIASLDAAAEKAAPNVERLTAALLANSRAEFAKQFGDITDSLNNIDPSGINGVRDSLNDLADKGGLAGRAVELGLSSFAGGSKDLDEVRHKADEAAASFASLDAALANIATTGSADQARQAFNDLVTSQGLSADQQKELLSLLPNYQEALQGAANQATLTAGATDQYASATTDAGSAADDAAQSIEDAVKAMEDQKDAAVSAFDAQTAYVRAMKEATAQAKRNDAGISGNSKAALKNRDVLSNLISSWNSLDQTVTDNVGKFKQARDNFIETATGMGVSKKAAEALWREMAKIPSSKVVPVTTPGMDDATNKARTLKSILDSLKSKDIYVALHYQTIGNKPHAPTPGVPNPRVSSDIGPGVTDRLRRAGVDTVAARGADLNAQAEAKAAYALDILAKQANNAGDAHKGLRERLKDLEKRLDRVSKAADDAHDNLQKLRDQKAGLSSSVSGALTHDPFGGGLSEFGAQVAADTADAEAMLAALRVLIQNGVDPHSAFFQQLAASGNVSLAQQFAALTRGELANYAASFAAQQSAATATGQFAGSAAFNDAIKAQVKVTQHLDSTVHHLAQQVKHLEEAIKHMPDKVRQGAKDGVEGKDRVTRDFVRSGTGRRH